MIELKLFNYLDRECENKWKIFEKNAFYNYFQTFEYISNLTTFSKNNISDNIQLLSLSNLFYQRVFDLTAGAHNIIMFGANKHAHAITKILARCRSKNLIIVDNNKSDLELTTLTMNRVSKIVRKFITSPVQNYKAKEWMKKELEARKR